MEKYLNLIMRYELTSDTLKSLKKMIKGKISYTAPYLSFDYITKEESAAVLSYLDSLGTYEISLDENYYTVEELLNFEYFYCDGQRKPDVGIDFVNFELVQNGNTSFDYTNFCVNLYLLTLIFSVTTPLPLAYHPAHSYSFPTPFLPVFLQL